MKLGRMLIVLCVALIVTGCTTTGHFKIPKDTDLYVYKMDKPVTVESDGTVTTKPYFWTAAGGVPYRLEKDGETIKKGRLRAKFRVVSIFWPPGGAIYWPMGLNPNIEYDLVNDTQN